MLWKTAKTEASRAEYVLVDTFVSWHMCGWYLVTCDPPKTDHVPSCNGIMDLWSTKTAWIWLEDLTSKLQRSQFYEAMTGFMTLLSTGIRLQRFWFSSRSTTSVAAMFLGTNFLYNML